MAGDIVSFRTADVTITAEATGDVIEHSEEQKSKSSPERKTNELEGVYAKCKNFVEYYSKGRWSDEKKWNMKMTDSFEPSLGIKDGLRSHAASFEDTKRRKRMEDAAMAKGAALHAKQPEAGQAKLNE